MKKILPLLSLFVLLFVFACENEPLEGDFETETDITCETALQNTVNAALAFVNFTEDNYTELCTAYKTALQAQIEACGDPDGSLQSGIDALGNCIPGTGNDCENATEAANLAQVNFENATADSYTDLCNAYKLVLENQITECGDDDGSIQSTIDGLGDCTPINTTGTLSVTTGTLNIQFNTNSAIVNSGMVVVTGSLTDQGANYHIYFEVPEGTTGIDVMQNFKLTLNGGEYFPDTSGLDDFTNNITVNSGGVIQGTFGGIVTRTDGANLNLSQGLVDLTY